MNLTDDLATLLASPQHTATPHSDITAARAKFAELVALGHITKNAPTFPTRQEEEQFFVLRSLQQVRDQTILRAQ